MEYRKTNFSKIATIASIKNLPRRSPTSILTARATIQHHWTRRIHATIRSEAKRKRAVWSKSTGLHVIRLWSIEGKATRATFSYYEAQPHVPCLQQVACPSDTMQCLQPTYRYPCALLSLGPSVWASVSVRESCMGTLVTVLRRGTVEETEYSTCVSPPCSAIGSDRWIASIGTRALVQLQLATG